MALKYRLETEDSESHYVVCDDTETGETVVMSTHTSKRWGNMLVQLLTDAYESGRAENARLKERITAMTNRIDADSSALDVLHSQIAGLKQQVDTWKEINAISDRAVARYKEQLKQHKGMYEVLQADKDEANQQCAHLYREVASLRQQLAEAQKEIRNEQHENAHLEFEITTLKAQLADAQAEIERLREALKPFANFYLFVKAGIEVGDIDPPTEHSAVISIMAGGGSDYIWWRDLQNAHKALSTLSTKHRNGGNT